MKEPTWDTETCFRLAEAMVSNLSLEHLKLYVTADLLELYESDREAFYLAWDNFYGKNEDEA